MGDTDNPEIADPLTHSSRQCGNIFISPQLWLKNQGLNETVDLEIHNNFPILL